MSYEEPHLASRFRILFDFWSGEEKTLAKLKGIDTMMLTRYTRTFTMDLVKKTFSLTLTVPSVDMEHYFSLIDNITGMRVEYLATETLDILYKRQFDDIKLLSVFQNFDHSNPSLFSSIEITGTFK